jgi:hypothetical protein
VLNVSQELSEYLDVRADFTSVYVVLPLNKSNVSIQPVHPFALELKFALFAHVDELLFDPPLIAHGTYYWNWFNAGIQLSLENPEAVQP